jgi:hypothetical protein
VERMELVERVETNGQRLLVSVIEAKSVVQ